MLNSKKKLISIYIVVIIIILSLLILTRISVVQGPNSLQDTKAIDILAGITLDTPSEPAKISKLTAIQKAWNSLGRLGFNRLTIEYQLVTINNTNVNKQPTYIISFKGNPGWLPPSVGLGSGVDSHTEYNILVDATNGKIIQSFEYR